MSAPSEDISHPVPNAIVIGSSNHKMSDTLPDDAEPVELRKEAGETLQHLRQARGLSQAQLAAVLDVHQKNFISQLEHGRRRIPPSKYEVTAHALDMDVKDFVKLMMRYYDPISYRILFNGEQAEM